MRVEIEGIPVPETRYQDDNVDLGCNKSSSAGEGVKKRGAGLPDEDSSAGEDDDEDDIRSWLWLTSCHSSCLQPQPKVGRTSTPIF